MKFYSVGTSNRGCPIQYFSCGAKPDILIMSGLHGDEIEGIALLGMLASHLKKSATHSLDRIAFLPIANPDGFFLNERWNASGVDLNRNFPTKNWTATLTNPRYPPGSIAASEPETRAVCAVLSNGKFSTVLDFHSFTETVVLPLLAHDNTLKKKALTDLGSQLGIPVMYEQEQLGYSIAGGLHTWCVEQGIDNITIEILKNTGQFEMKERYLGPIVTYIASLIAQL